MGTLLTGSTQVPGRAEETAQWLRAQSCWLTFSPVAVAAHRGSRKGQQGIACVHSLMCQLGLSGSWDDITEREARQHLECAVLVWCAEEAMQWDFLCLWGQSHGLLRSLCS